MKMNSNKRELHYLIPSKYWTQGISAILIFPNLKLSCLILAILKTNPKPVVSSEQLGAWLYLWTLAKSSHEPALKPNYIKISS